MYVVGGLNKRGLEALIEARTSGRRIAQISKHVMVCVQKETKECNWKQTQLSGGRQGLDAKIKKEIEGNEGCTV
jgi:hypothetical protein